jgi:CBS domain-containing protein
MDVWELARLLTTRGITGAPVVGGNGKLLGVVSQTDIVRHLEEFVRSPSAEFDFYRESEGEPRKPARPVPTVKDLMNPTVIQADEETPVQELALIMTRHAIHRVIITRGQKVVGIVATMDLIPML